MPRCQRSGRLASANCATSATSLSVNDRDCAAATAAMRCKNMSRSLDQKAPSPRRRQRRNNCLYDKNKPRLINLAAVGPFAPMCRRYVDALIRSIHPISSAFADWEHQRVDAALVHHTDLKVGIGWRN